MKNSLTSNVSKNLLIMKLSFIFCVFFSFTVSGNVLSQSKVNFEAQNISIREAFKEIRKQTGLIIIYSEKEVSNIKKISINLKDSSVDDALNTILKDVDLTYELIDEYVVIKPVKKIQNPPKPIAIQDKIEIKGRVIDEEGNPIPFASVQIKGTTQGVASDFEGVFNFEIDLQENIVLIVSSIGYNRVEYPYSGKDDALIVLKEEASALSEVVVIGYGTEKKALLTGSISTVNSKQLEDQPVPTIDGIIQGQATGVQVTQNSGTPGGEISVRIRGISSISGSSQPLYIIDGIPITTGDFAQIGYEGQGASALSDLNPSDIESISILKDAASTSIYGARASNGIVLITTKRGKKQNSVINVNAYSGVQQAWRKLDMLNSRQWMEYRNDLSGSTVFTQEDMDNITIDTDWQDKIFRIAPISSYDVSSTGGNDDTKFFINGNYFDQEGILIGTDYQRYSGRMNIDHKLFEKVTIGTSISLSYAKTDRVEGDQSLHGPLPNGISTPAIYPVYNADKSYNQDGPYSNPVSIANEAINENFSYRTNSNAYLDYFILPGLIFSSKWGVDFLNFREHAYESIKTVQGAKYNGLGFETYTNVSNIISNNILKYQKELGNHKAEILAGYSFERYSVRSSYIRGQDFADVNLQYINSASTITSASSGAYDEGLSSFFGRANYNYNNKYIASLSGRFDSSTKFGENNKTGFFPAASFAWRVTEEDFMDIISQISDLKVRASYGLTGNDDIPSFLFAELYGNTSYAGQPAIYPSNIPNPDLKWETTAQLNIGLNLGMFNDRITVTADYYNKQTNDLLLSRPIPLSSGFSSITENIGKVENKGFEFSIATQNFTETFKWSTQLNISANRNKVLKLYNGQAIDDIGRGGNRIEEGEPIGIFYSYESLGVDPSTGDIVYADNKIDGVITSEDRTKVGDPHPDFIGGLTNSFSYKGFDLTIFLQGSYGNDVFNGSRLYLEGLQGGDNQLEAVTRRWTEPGDITDIPRATTDPVKSAENKRVSSRFIEDGSYLRIKNLTVGYSFKIKKTSSNLRVYFSAQNLMTFTNYSGLDPEVNYRGDDNQVIGTDFFTYPQARTFTFGINLKI